MSDYETLARAVSGFTDQLEIAANQATEQRKVADLVMRQLFRVVPAEYRMSVVRGQGHGSSSASGRG